MRAFLVLLVLAFVVTLFVVVGVRVSSHSHTFLVGLVCGMAASVPASILAHLLGRRQTQPDPASAAPHYPPVYIVNGALPPPARPAPDFPPRTNPELSGAPRPRYRVIGEEGE
jgi:hypothetical protein